MKILNYILLLYFSFGACIPKSDFSQVAQFNDVLEHYELHQKEERVSFSEFLYIHFIEGDEHQHSDPSEHEKLPFKYVSDIIYSLFFELKTSSLDVAISFFFQKEIIVYKENFYKNSFLFKISHPPTFFIV